ncbi:uncharacterized protein [Leptinotarsa decemlineata]|uniref:uncharacterized protein n=1 Tax=Leptinotarsa decemlineata TaxID=7539 RepID=UPI003D3082AE
MLYSFISTKAPNFGGLWESQIKVLKTHLFRVIGSQLLTYEEMNTVLVQIEAVLNSRPLCPISSDANDLQALTPGHFLTLEPLNSPPDSDLSHVKLSHLSRWQLLQQMHQSFWNRWHNEYLHTLMQRKKWTKPSSCIDLGTMVLVKNGGVKSFLTPPLNWNLGRITRVVSIKTASSELRRPVTQVCPLPDNI